MCSPEQVRSVASCPLEKHVWIVTCATQNPNEIHRKSVQSTSATKYGPIDAPTYS
jgi:hypothetical protein